MERGLFHRVFFGEGATPLPKEICFIVFILNVSFKFLLKIFLLTRCNLFKKAENQLGAQCAILAMKGGTNSFFQLISKCFTFKNQIRFFCKALQLGILLSIGELEQLCQQ